MAFFFVPDSRRRTTSFRDQDNLVAYFKDKDTSEQYYFSWEEDFDANANETVDVIGFQTTGNITMVQVGAGANGAIKYQITGTGGTVEFRMQTTEQRILKQTFRFYETTN